MEGTKEELVLENLWKKDEPAVKEAVMKLWLSNFPAMPQHIFQERLDQLVFVVRNQNGNVVGVSTAYKVYIKHLKNYMYSFRCFLDPLHRIPGLTTKLIVSTRDLLEEIYQTDGPENERCIGMITLVENERILKYRKEAIWPGSGMVYIGNSPKGNHLRAYYFNKALI